MTAMRARILLTMFVGLLLGGCGDEGCVSPDRAFTVDLDVLESDVAAILADGIERAEIECDEACEQVYYRDRGGQPSIKETKSCALELDDAPGATPGAVVGHVVCEGTDNPNGCE